MTTQTKWEEQLDNEYDTRYENGDVMTKEDVKQFIRSLLSHQAEEARDEGYEAGLQFNKSRQNEMEKALVKKVAEEIKEKCEEMKSTKFYPIPQANYNVTVGWNQALTDLIDFIKNKYL